MTKTNPYNQADQQAGIAYAEQVASQRFALLGERVSAATKMLMGCAFEAGAAHAREAGQAAPAGWQMVPVEPNDDMLVAGQEVWAQGRIGAIEDCSEAQAIYAAMLAAAPAAPVAQEPVAWLPYLADRADGVQGHYAIARHNPAGHREVWNLRSHRWAAFSDDVLTKEQALDLLQKLTIPTAPPAVEQPAMSDMDKLLCPVCGGNAYRNEHSVTEQRVAVNRSVIRDVFLRNGFTIKEGHSDLKPYVYAAAEELLALDAPTQYGDGFHAGYWKGRASMADELAEEAREDGIVRVPMDLMKKTIERMELAGISHRGSEFDKLRALLAGGAE